MVLYSSYHYQATGNRTYVSPDMFGVNTLIHRDEVGVAGKLPGTIEKVDATIVRYPGGTVTEEFFDPSNPDRTSGVSLFTGKLESSLLPLSDFLSFADQAEKGVLLVLPTYRYFDSQTRGLTSTAEAELRLFVRSLLSGAYGEVQLAGFEIGNEWYSNKFDWSAGEFGRLQARIALWIHEEAAALSVDVPIFVQAGRGDDDQNGIRDNLELASAFDNGTIGVVDGLISHIYIATSSTNPMSLGGSVAARLATVDADWGGRFGRDFSQVVTEWNVGEDGPTNTSINGLMRSAPLVHLFATMVNSGVDLASVWTAQNSSPAALAGPESGTTTLTPTGLLFRILASHLPGTELNSIDASSILRSADGSSIGYSYTFVDDTRTVFVISSAINDSISITAHVGAVVGASSHVFGLLLGALDSDSGTQFRSRGQIEVRNLLDLDGSIAGDGVLDVRLLPFETILIVVSNGAPVVIEADPQTSVDDHLIGSNFDDTLRGFSGDDTIYGMDGSDVISLGDGNDVGYGGAGDDRFELVDHFVLVDGGDGKDILDFSSYLENGIYLDPTGRLSSTSLALGQFRSIEGIVGTDKADQIYAPQDFISIDGAAGNDFIFVFVGDGKDVFGGDGNDRITSRTDSNTVLGGGGSDRIYSLGNCGYIDGGEGNDRISVAGEFSTVRDSDGDDIYVFTDSYGLTFDCTSALGHSTVYGFNLDSHRLLLGEERVLNSVIEQSLDSFGNASLSIVGDGFSIDLVGVQHLPSEMFQPGVFDWF
jgi:RTX calcium-binding nonapeptide repeat (4 copies)